MNARGLVALVLALGVTAALIITAAGAAFHQGPVSDQEASLLSTVLGAAVGATAAYLGLSPPSRPPPRPPEDTHPNDNI